MQKFRKSGAETYEIAVIHGGPRAPGEMAPVARKLARALSVGVIEPMQTKLTIDGQLEELKDVIE